MTSFPVKTGDNCFGGLYDYKIKTARPDIRGPVYAGSWRSGELEAERRRKSLIEGR